MRKYIVFLFLSLSVFAQTNQTTIFKTEESNSSKAADKLIKELKDDPVVIEQKKEVKLKHKKITEIKKDIEFDLIDVDNKLVEIKNIISTGFKNKASYNSILKKLEKIEVHDFSEKYIRDLSVLKESPLKTKLLSDVEKLKKNINEINDLKKSLLEKYEVRAELEQTVVSKTKIDTYLITLNKKFGKVANPYLKTINLDIGKVILFFALMILFITSGIIFNKILNLLFSILDSSEEELIIDEKKETTDFNSIKKPMLFFFILVGFQLSLEILAYPNILPIWMTLTFITLNVINVLIIIYKLIDILLYIFSHKGYIKTNRSEVINLISRGFKILFFIIASVLLLSKYGVNTTRIIASLGIGSLAIAFASKDMLSKFFSGVKLIIDDSFSIGDWVYFQFNGREGTIIDVGFINTTIRTFDNALLVIPNSKIADGSYINWSRRKIGRKIGITLGLKYSSKREDIKNALKDLKEMLENHKGISSPKNNFSKKKVTNGKLVSIGDSLGLKNTLMVHLTKFADSGIEIDIYAFSRTVMWEEWRDVVQDVMFEIMEILEKNNLELAYPSQSIYIEDMNQNKED